MAASSNAAGLRDQYRWVLARSRPRRHLSALAAGQAPGTDLAFGDARQLPPGRRDETIRRWDAHSHEPVRVLHGHTASVTALVATPDRTRLVSAAADGSLRWWDTGLADLSGTAWKHPGDVYGFDYSRGGVWAASAAWGGHLALWETATGRQVWRNPIHDSSANAVAFSPGGRRLVLGRERRPAATGRRANGRHRHDLGRSEGRQGSRNSLESRRAAGLLSVVETDRQDLGRGGRAPHPHDRRREG